MASSPITPWQTHGGEMEIVTDFIFLSSKITVDSDCSHEIKRHLLLERKAMTNLNSVLKKQKHHFVVKGSSSQSCGFSSSHVWMWELGIKKTECPRIDALELWCWRRLLRVPWTARRWNQSVLKEINPEHSLEGLMLKLKLQYFGQLKRPWCWERLKVGGEGDYRGWDGWAVSLTQWTWVWASSGSWWWTGKPGMLQSMGSQRVGHDWATKPNWQVLSEDLVSALAAAAGILVIIWDRGKKCFHRNSRAVSWREPGPPSQPLTT